LDVGCGEGILQELLSSQYSRYVGIDIAAEAIRRATLKQDEKTIFVTADASKYTPDEQFDIIIFNECLYYFEDPLSIMRRYERFLKEDGIFIVSMYILEKNLGIWRMLEAEYAVMDEVQVSHKSGISWIIKVINVTHSSSLNNMKVKK
jgi:2-polyprenyl-3-methyl-5-hydroxy-6-metoxy-1,4-benzoquinol methylase